MDACDGLGLREDENRAGDCTEERVGVPAIACEDAVATSDGTWEDRT